MSTNVSFGFLAQHLGKVLDGREASLGEAIAGMGENPTQAELLQFQTRLQQWTLLIDLQSTVTKQLGDALKGVIQKSG